MDNEAVSIKHIIKRTKAEGPYGKDITLALLYGKIAPGSSTSTLLWQEAKPEMYAISAVIMDRVHKRLIKEKNVRPPYGLLEEPQEGKTLIHTIDQQVNTFPVHDTFGYLHSAFRTSMMKALIDELNDLHHLYHDANSQEPIRHIYDRYCAVTLEWGRRMRTYSTTEEASKITPNQEPFIFLQRGIETSEVMMSGTIEAILEVYKREKKPDEPLDPQTLTTIAKNSYPFLVELASHHLAVLNKIGKFLFIQRSEEKLHLLKIMPEYLTLIQSKNGYRLGFTPEAQKKIDQIIAEHDKTDDKSPLVRCIGLQNVEGNSMIKDMWDWHIEVAPDVYAVALKQPLAS